MKKGIAFNIFIFTISLFLYVNFISAINLDISVKPVSDSYIINLDKPATFDLVITNFGDSDDFEIYSLVGVNIMPDKKFRIITGETKKISISAKPQQALISKRGFFTFEYLIKNSKNEIQKGKLSMNIVGLEDAISIIPDNLNMNSELMPISIKNTIMYDFNEVKIEMKSPFFTDEKLVSLKSLEEKDFNIPLDKEKLKKSDAGPYLINVKITTLGKSAEKEVLFKFMEQDNIESSESTDGILVRRTEIIKNNLGNVRKTVFITANKDLISYIFTSVNIQPTKTEVNGFRKYYSWEKELAPGEQLKIIIKTNWIYPILVILFIIILYFLIKRYLEIDLILKKKVSFVQTRGGEFALKVQVKVRAKRYVEHIHLKDRLPSLVSLYEKFGAIAPDNIDIKNKILEWNIESLNPREERIFSYIIYSKIGVVGKFELPSATAVYEKDGNIKDARSNRAFFINEPKKQVL